jgi:tetratricopeptide (TPR) repeat protein
VALLGEIGAWQLRDTYESIVGRKPQRDWSWERTARELFGEFDRLRLAQVYEQFERGLSAQSAGDTPAMKQAFDKVLARNPNFDRRSEMAPGYLKFATERADTDRPAALDALRRARRIAETDDRKKPAESLLLTLEAEQLLGRGVADQLLLRRAIELDPSNQRARDVLQRIERGETQASRDVGRYAAAIAIAVVALVGILLIAVRRIRPARAGVTASQGGRS